MTNTTVNFATDEKLLDGILKFFTHLCNEGVVSMIPYAEYLITVFCVIDLGMSWWLYEGELRFPALLQKILKMSAFLFIIYNWQYIIGLIESSFCYIGYIASGHTSQEALDLINIEGVKQGSLFSPSTLWEKFCACIEQLSGEMNGIGISGIGKLFGWNFIFPPV